VDSGGRVSQLQAAGNASGATATLLAKLGLTPQGGDSAVLLAHCETKLAGESTPVNAHLLHNMAGRLLHDLGKPKQAIECYTKSLQAKPSVGAVFRNMGSAYHATADMQLAFASYQQAVALDSSDTLGTSLTFLSDPSAES